MVFLQYVKMFQQCGIPISSCLRVPCSELRKMFSLLEGYDCDFMADIIQMLESSI